MPTSIFFHPRIISFALGVDYSIIKLAAAEKYHAAKNTMLAILILNHFCGNL